MLAKVIRLKNERGGHVSAEKLMDYLARNGDGKGLSLANYIGRDGVSGNDKVEGGSFNLEGLPVESQEDRRLLVQMMDYVSEAGRKKTHYKTNPLYHFALSWREGEHFDADQAREAAAESLKALGMAENQAFYVIHRDKDHHHHIHVVANRVHPDKLILTGPPRYDFLVLDKTCREIELQQGWQHDHGPYIVIDGEIQRLSKTQRKELGLIKDPSTTEHRQTPAARMAEINNGVPSLASWMRSRVAPELLAELEAPGATWQSFHQALGKRGIRLEHRGGGLIFAAQATWKETSTKASGIDYKFSLGRLQKQLGPFQPPTNEIAAVPGKTYQQFVRNVMTGAEVEHGECPGKTGTSKDRQSRREERAKQRDILLDRFNAERGQMAELRKSQRYALRQKQARERSGLLKTLGESKSDRLSSLEKHYGSKAIAKALWAAERAAAIENLDAGHKIERADFQKLSKTDWPSWLQNKADQGDTAAISALRGLRYKEQRKRNKERAGFEGEDLEEDLKPHQDEKLQQPNAIGGDVRTFTLARAQIEVDREYQRVIYSDSEGRMKLIDSGPRVDVLDKDDKDSIRAGLVLASQKFGGEIYITGSGEFRERAAREAALLGIRVADQDLQHIKHEVEQIRNQLDR